jgi:hypothetical protein
MPTFFTEQAYAMDPFAPPLAGTSLTVVTITIEDRNDNDVIGPASGTNASRDQVNGSPITGVYVGDTVTVQYPDGSTQTITGVTFYTANGARFFTPTDGTFMRDATFLSSTAVPTSTSVPVSALFPPCFAAGTPILTPDGEVPVECLVPGDIVVTLDHGPQRVIWAGQRKVSGLGRHAPIRFAAGAIGNSVPLEVSPQHRMLIRGWRAELLFGEPEVLAAACHLVDGDRISRAPRDSVTYVHLMFDRHEIVHAAGVPSESFNPGADILRENRTMRAELAELFPDLSDRLPEGPLLPPSRPLTRGAEARALRVTGV